MLAATIDALDNWVELESVLRKLSEQELTDLFNTQIAHTGRYLIHKVCETRYSELSLMILLSYGANPNQEAQNKMRPLHIASVKGSTEKVRHLLIYKAQINATFNGHTAAYYALQSNHVTALQKLIVCGADVQEELYNAIEAKNYLHLFHLLYAMDPSQISEKQLQAVTALRDPIWSYFDAYLNNNNHLKTPVYESILRKTSILGTLYNFEPSLFFQVNQYKAVVIDYLYNEITKDEQEETSILTQRNFHNYGTFKMCL